MTLVLDDNQMKKAIKALMSHCEKVKESGATRQLFEDEGDVFNLQIALKKIPEKVSEKPVRIELPYSLFPANGEMCLIVKDPQRVYKDRVQAEGISQVTKVVGVSKLRAKFKQYEQKRNLCSSFDLFLADDRIVRSFAPLPKFLAVGPLPHDSVRMLPHLIGSVFFQKKKQPIVIDCTKKNLKLQIERAKKCSLLYVAAGSCSMLRFGNSKFSVEKNAENLACAIEQMIKSVPGKHKNIQALSIKTNDSIAIPIFTSLPDRDAVATAAGLASRS